MRASERGEVGPWFDLDAKRDKVEIVCEMYGGEEVCEKSGPISSLFLFFLFFFVIMRSLF